jgi:hypothetical protein
LTRRKIWRATSESINFGENTGDPMCFNFTSYSPKDALSCGAGLLGGGLIGGAGEGLLGGLLGR